MIVDEIWLVHWVSFSLSQSAVSFHSTVCFLFVVDTCRKFSFFLSLSCWLLKWWNKERGERKKPRRTHSPPSSSSSLLLSFFVKVFIIFKIQNNDLFPSLFRSNYVIAFTNICNDGNYERFSPKKIRFVSI